MYLQVQPSGHGIHPNTVAAGTNAPEKGASMMEFLPELTIRNSDQWISSPKNLSCQLTSVFDDCGCMWFGGGG
jgi:hypothetical protein